MLTRHFVKPSAAAAAATHVDMLRTDASLQIFPVTPEGNGWRPQQDPAGPHAAAATKQFLADHAVAPTPSMPGGADCNPLDIFSTPTPRRCLGGGDGGTQT